jgi:hypothetical protein
MANTSRLQQFFLAFYGRAADPAGLNYWATQMDGRLKNQDVALAAALGSNDQAEFRTLYGNTPTVSSFTTAVYQNLFGRQAESAGIKYWQSRYEAGLKSGYSADNLRAVMIVWILDGAQGSDAVAVTNKSSLATEYSRQLTARSIGINNDDLPAMKSLFAGTGSDAWYESSAASLTESLASVSKNDTMEDKLTALAASTMQQPSPTSPQASIAYSKSYVLEYEQNTGNIVDSLTMTLTGDTFKGAFGAKLGTVTGVPAGLTAQLVKVSDTTARLTFSGFATTHTEAATVKNLKVVFSDADFSTVKAATVENAVRDNLVIGFIDAYLSESGGTMRSSASKITTSVSIDLSTDKISFGSGDGRLISGQATSITSIDLSDAVPGGPAGGAAGGGAGGAAGASVSFKGDEAANLYVASYVGDRIEGGDGKDTLVGGAGIDRFVFSSTADLNGVDRIQKFKVGAGGDILDFSAFLTKTGTTNIKTMNANAPSVAGNKWSSSDVIVVEGYNLKTAAAVAALFDTDGAGTRTGLLATPTSVSKAVLITADVIGDAYVWYMVKSANISATVNGDSVVTSSEIELVGVLEGVNTLTLVPMVAGNFG